MSPKKTFFSWLIAGNMLFSVGCAHISEGLKSFWGSSTKALEDARIDAARNIYTGSWNDCFDQVLAIAKEEELTVFIRDKNKKRIVLMGIPRTINTTEVGVFFSDLGSGKAEVEVVSLSIEAQEIASEIIFSGLEKIFPQLKP
ncbi:MAG TPA: hypothetical protein PL155_07035 [Candidatus Omnitrophota bacterium]|nr:hypothetical protein [Candidatus Omnitrophota bacterium]HPD85536.1 hypothetical protein [Candidatus Omnitrophota bacterium]HRZ04424.1 hypothetical protein [Candidatus Omnitrophota bacterium]